MGCWNHTCMLSSLPVRYGEDIATVILMKTRDGYADCDPRRDWYPAPVMFYGSYDDCGGSEHCYGSEIPYILKEFRDNQPVVEEGKEKEFTNIDALSRAGDAGELSLHGNRNGNVDLPIRFAVIKTSVLDSLLEQYYFTSYHLKNSNGDEVKITYKYLCGTIPLYIAKLKAYVNTDDMFQVWEPLPEIAWNDTDVLGAWLQQHNKDVVLQFFRQSFTARLIALVESNDDEGLTQLLEEFCKHIIICRFMIDSRRMYTHATGGSQDIDMSAQETMARITLSVAAQQRLEDEKDDLPDDAWDPKREVFIEQCEIEF